MIRGARDSRDERRCGDERVQKREAFGERRAREASPSPPSVARDDLQGVAREERRQSRKRKEEAGWGRRDEQTERDRFQRQTPAAVLDGQRDGAHACARLRRFIFSVAFRKLRVERGRLTHPCHPFAAASARRVGSAKRRLLDDRRA